MADANANDEIWRQRRVLAVIGMGRSWLYGAIARGEFPAAIRLGARAIGWRKSDVLAWIESRQPNGKS